MQNYAQDKRIITDDKNVMGKILSLLIKKYGEIMLEALILLSKNSIKENLLYTAYILNFIIEIK